MRAAHGYRSMLRLVFLGAFTAANLFLLDAARGWRTAGEPASESAEPSLPPQAEVVDLALLIPEKRDPESLARSRAARIEARIQGIPEMARRAGRRGIEYAHAIDEEELRAGGYPEVEIEAHLKYKEAILEYYRLHPEGR